MSMALYERFHALTGKPSVFTVREYLQRRLKYLLKSSNDIIVFLLTLLN